MRCDRRGSSAGVPQQARNLAMALGEAMSVRRFLIRDRDTKFSGAFDEVFRSEGVRVIRTPVQVPRANAYAERFVGTVRRECLDWMLIVGRRHLAHVLHLYIDHYNTHRPHRGLDLSPPQPSRGPGRHAASPSHARLHRTDRLGGLIHEYSPAA